jgi:hypothetical protein
MMAVAERFEELQAAAQATNWRGRSGRLYALELLPVDQFSLADGELYLLAAAHRVLWVGTLDEIVAEALARSQFRLALGAADSAFRVAAPTNEIERMTLVWDLEGAEPATGLSLA